MKKTPKFLSVIVAALLLSITLVSAAFAANVLPGKDLTVMPPPVLCKDPAVSDFTVAKTLSNNIATFTMTGKICNNGPGDYNLPDNALEAHFNVYAAYGPMFSYPAAGEVKFFTQNVGTVLKKGECKSFTQVFTRDKVLQWGFRAPLANEKQMKLLFEFFVRDAKGTLGTVSQPKGLDCNLNNNLLSQTFEMMVRVP
jgi:hypothetical protein